MAYELPPVPTGRHLVRHDGKTEAAPRVTPLPRTAADMLRRRLMKPGEPEWPVFPTAGRDGQVTYRWPATVRQTLQSVREDLDLGWMTPHTWRHTYATILDDELTNTELRVAPP